jgi:hypothetical protein
MNERPTPETDNQIFKAWDDEGHYSTWVVDADFARRLERQRDEAQDAALEMEFRLKQAERRNVEHEDDYLAVWRAIKRPNETVLEACNRILRQRDELLEALEACRYDSCELLGERNWWKDEHRCDYRKRYEETAANIVRADAAIAAVKGVDQ